MLELLKPYEGVLLFVFILACIIAGGSVLIHRGNFWGGIAVFVIGSLVNFAEGEALFVAKLVATQDEGSLASFIGYTTAILTLIIGTALARKYPKLWNPFYNPPG